MEIIWAKEEALGQGKNKYPGKVYSAYVKIRDVSSRAKEMVATVSNTSWIDGLDVVSKVTFEATSERTINKLVNSIFEKIEDSVTVEFGEYMISDTAQETLKVSFNHLKLPLADIIKEKVTGNPGFDFHTETQDKHIAYGEAKYSGSISPHANALSQIVEFIKLKKDDAELVLISRLVSEEATNNSASGNKAYVAAFSVNGKSPETIISNALSSSHVKELLHFPEIYIIGVSVDAE